jgi:hypothetical protein
MKNQDGLALEPLAKGQLISKGLFGILNSSKKKTTYIPRTIQPEVS